MIKEIVDELVHKIDSLKKELESEKEISKNAINQLIAERGAKYRIGQKVRAYVMFDEYEFTIAEVMTGPDIKYKLEWPNGNGSFWEIESRINI